MFQPQILQVNMVDPGELKNEIRGVVLTVDEVQFPHIILVTAILVCLRLLEIRFISE